MDTDIDCCPSPDELKRLMTERAFREGHGGVGLDTYHQWVTKYGSPFIQTPHGPMIRPSLMGLQ